MSPFPDRSPAPEIGYLRTAGSTTHLRPAPHGSPNRYSDTRSVTALALRFLGLAVQQVRRRPDRQLDRDRTGVAEGERDGRQLPRPHDGLEAIQRHGRSAELG